MTTQKRELTPTEQTLVESFNNPYDKELRKRAFALSSAEYDGEFDGWTEEQMFAEFCAAYWRCPEDKRERLVLWADLIIDDIMEEQTADTKLPSSLGGI
jgi:hypothetical protein